MIVSFEFSVMNFVDFVVDCYSHITSHISQAFASCTHNTSYSLLNIVHVMVCVFGLTNKVWKILWVLCKTDLLLEKKNRDCLKSKFLEELGSKSWGLWKSFISYSCIFKKIFNAWRRGCLKFCWFSKIHFFYNFDRSSLFFDRSNLFFDPSKLHLKISVSLCLVWLIEPIFRSIEHRESSFLKIVFWLIQTTFSTFSLSLQLGKAAQKIFCRFRPNFCKVFLPQGR